MGLEKTGLRADKIGARGGQGVIKFRLCAFGFRLKAGDFGDKILPLIRQMRIVFVQGGGVEFEKKLALFDGVAFADMDGGHAPAFRVVDDLDAAKRSYDTGRIGHLFDGAKACPYQGGAEKQDNRKKQGARQRRGLGIGGDDGRRMKADKVAPAPRHGAVPFARSVRRSRTTSIISARGPKRSIRPSTRRAM